MHVTRVELDNIKSYERGEFSFGRGTTAIVGENGAGKTTILEAIAWTLFDVLDYSKDDFLRRGSKKGSVRVTFTSDLDERLYTVYRDTGNGYYVFDPELKVKLAEKKADVRSFLNLHLGVEPGTDLRALFRSAIGVPQGFFTTDFLQPAASRKLAFDRLLKVEEYRESAEALRDTVNLIRERAAEARGRVSGAEAQLARFESVTADERSARARVSELEDALAALRAEAEARARAVEELDARESATVETRAAAGRLEVESESGARRLAELRAAREVAERAAARQRATEPDYRAHLEAAEALRALEAERAERDRLTGERAAAERLIAAGATDVRRLEESAARAAAARDSLAALAGDVARQDELERERERLRDLLAHARAAGERLGRLDRELATLRRQHAETRERVRAAEGAADAQERVEKLESERLGVENRLNQVAETLTKTKLLAGQRRDLARDAERLARSVSQLERESRELEQAEAAAVRAQELEGRERELEREAARLRAAIEHDERVREETRGGVCPILGEQCESFSGGRTFDAYFGDRLKEARARLASAERELAGLVREVAAAREAERRLARFETSRRRLAEERALLSERESSLSRIDAQLAALPPATESLRDSLQAEFFGIDAGLKTAREASMRYAELETLRERLAEIEEEGKAKREEREELSATAGAADGLERDVREAEASLRALEDPRARAAALRAEASREEATRAELETARGLLREHEARRSSLEGQLDRFKDLDARWARLSARREETAAAHREHLESRSLADTLPEREREVAEAEALAGRVAEELSAAREAHARAVEAYDRARHTEERGALALARERIAATSANLDTARAAAERLADEIARLEAVRASWQEELRSIERLDRLHETTDFVRDVLKAAGPLVTESYLYNISIEANQLFREITGEGGRALRWTRDYEIVVEEGGYERPFVNLSGGEQMVAALSVRLALLKQLSDIRVAFFDEPTVNMDVERRERLAQQLGQVRHFDQLFVISHDDAFEQNVDHVVTVARTAERRMGAEG